MVDHTEIFMKCMDLYQIKDSNQEQERFKTMLPKVLTTMNITLELLLPSTRVNLPGIRSVVVGSIKTVHSMCHLGTNGMASH